MLKVSPKLGGNSCIKRKEIISKFYRTAIHVFKLVRVGMIYCRVGELIIAKGGGRDPGNYYKRALSPSSDNL